MKYRFDRTILAIALVIASYIATIPEPHQVGNQSAPKEHQPARPFSIVVLPDTQVYAQFFPEIFKDQTQWIAEHKNEQNIVFVTHEGDIVNIPEAEEQWQVADAAFANLDGVVPYGLAPGNHDFIFGNSPHYAKYFPMSRLKHPGTWGGSYREFIGGEDKNSFHKLNAGAEKYIIFNLEFCPPDAIIDWVGTVLLLHPQHKAIITTHSFTDFHGQRSNKITCLQYGSEGDNAGEEMWQKLVIDRPHPNIHFFLSGHDISTSRGAARRTDMVNGKPIHQLLANYQQLPNGGNGFLRIMTFNPSMRKTTVETYSPSLDKYMTDSQNRFELTY